MKGQCSISAKFGLLTSAVRFRTVKSTEITANLAGNYWLSRGISRLNFARHQ
jgi:hypothetical protein